MLQVVQWWTENIAGLLKFWFVIHWPNGIYVYFKAPIMLINVFNQNKTESKAIGIDHWNIQLHFISK